MKITQTPYIDHSDLNRVWLDTEVPFQSVRLEMNGWTEEKDTGASGTRIELRVPRVKAESLLHVTAFDDAGKRYAASALLRPVKVK